MARVSLRRLSGRRTEWTRKSRQGGVEGYVGGHQGGSAPGQLPQVGRVRTWASPLQAVLALTAFCPRAPVGRDSQGLQGEAEMTMWSLMVKTQSRPPRPRFPRMGGPASLHPSQRQEAFQGPPLRGALPRRPPVRRGGSQALSKPCSATPCAPPADSAWALQLVQVPSGTWGL